MDPQVAASAGLEAATADAMEHPLQQIADQAAAVGRRAVPVVLEDLAS